MSDPFSRTDEPIQPTLNDGDAFSVAEAYPSEADDDSSALLSSANDDTAAAAENDVYQPEQNADEAAAGAADDYEPQSDAGVVPAPVAAPVAPAAVANDFPVAPPKKHNRNNKKKVTAAPAAGPAAQEAGTADKTQQGAAFGAFPGTFFPMNFGSTSGGAIAVANSFSTGKGGAASHAVAYGSAGQKSAVPVKRRRNN